VPLPQQNLLLGKRPLELKYPAFFQINPAPFSLLGRAVWALTSIRCSTAKELTRFLLFVRDGEEWKPAYDQGTPLTNPHHDVPRRR
jgi:hypothetical protein